MMDGARGARGKSDISASGSGPTVKQLEVIALGNRRNAGGKLIAYAAVTNDLLDVRPLKRILLEAGLHFDEDGELSEPHRVVAALIKSGALFGHE